jgi:ribonucleoside-diphosphate reductase alpha chain
MKSGGKTRRAAKMVILDVEHPDIRDYIGCKVDAERQAHDLIDMGWSTEFNDPKNAYAQVPFQNANHSVRVTDNFMEAVQTDGTYMTKLVTTGKVHEELQASTVWDEIANAAWFCGDPGLQFDDIINDWNTCAVSGKQNGTNPCSEFLFLDDTACNLASINLMKFRHEDGTFDVEGFRHAVDVLFLAQEILVDRSSYPTEEGRSMASAITAVMGGRAYRRSAEIAETKGTFEKYDENSSPMMRVIRKHRQEVKKIKGAPKYLVDAAKQDWADAVDYGKSYGFRNAQATLLAPTGTISFLMDCDTTGIEPDLTLVKSKKLVGGGEMSIANQTVPLALQTLGYTETEVNAILDYMDESHTIEGAPGLKDEHLPVFDCALKPPNGLRSIAPSGHTKMMAAAQPFLSGAISKTVNMPKDTTVDEIKATYMEAWEMGLKTLALYRDGCKKSQPLNTAKKVEAEGEIPVRIVEVTKPLRKKLPETRQALNHKFDINGYEGYVNVGMYENGDPGEIFITMSKQGSTINGLMDAFATSLSIGLQHRVPLAVYVDKFQNMRFEPQGLTMNKDIRTAHSVMDYIAKYLRVKFPQCFDDEAEAAPDMMATPKPGTVETVEPTTDKSSNGADKKGNGFSKTAAGPAFPESDAPFCRMCGNQMVPMGGCHFCYNCKDSSSCG